MPRLRIAFLCLFIAFAGAAYAAEPSVETFARGLQTPWAIAFAPDGRVFLTERPGRIRVIEKGALAPEPWMRLDVVETGESGLLGLALDPAFDKNRYVYAAYTYRDARAGMKNRLVRLRDEKGKGVLDRVLVDNAVGAQFHDGGRVKFGPDGKLYWSVGDAVGERSAQNLSSLNGKILRFNTDGSFPADNPFPKSPVYSYGHRNPEGFAWLPKTGRLYATEHGPSGTPSCCHDEVNFIEAGKNYGWPVIYGAQTKDGMLPPVIESGANDTWAPAGAVFSTRGPWAGSFLFTGLRGQALYRVFFDAKDPRKVASFDNYFRGRFGRLRDVVEGPDGALYLLTSNRDGRGRPVAEDDRVLRITFK
ncbi:MAG TPA: PQQ-dependent sugar dehydrogenase [Candidatus Binatia bacterium]|jgi:glucose/arabinose dehydrogenase